MATYVFPFYLSLAGYKGRVLCGLYISKKPYNLIVNSKVYMLTYIGPYFSLRL